MSPFFTPSHLLSLASTALYTMPLASSSLLLAALSVPVLAQVTESAKQLEVRYCCLRSIMGGFRRGGKLLRLIWHAVAPRKPLKVALLWALGGGYFYNLPPLTALKSLWALSSLRGQIMKVFTGRSLLQFPPVNTFKICNRKQLNSKSKTNTKLK